ncbi:MAG: sugar ABC transporter permease, partial [Clostridiales bacterium]|nr:sugar ABC transporter permease [Clostridiales bacterium]
MVKVRFKEKSKFRKYGSLLLFLLPAVLLAFVFCYIPMAGLIMAFKQEIDLTAYESSVASILMTPWGGFSQFIKLFAANSDFLRVLGNTLFISVLKIVLVFPIPILLSILITEVSNKT